jgi:hypothetical protein
LSASTGRCCGARHGVAGASLGPGRPRAPTFRGLLGTRPSSRPTIEFDRDWRPVKHRAPRSFGRRRHPTGSGADSTSTRRANLCGQGTSRRWACGSRCRNGRRDARRIPGGSPAADPRTYRSVSQPGFPITAAPGCDSRRKRRRSP